MPSCDSTRPVHRDCLRTWPDRYRYTQQRFARWLSLEAASPDWVIGLLHRTATIGATVELSLHKGLLDEGPWLDHVNVKVWHAAALHPADFALEDWAAWVWREQPVWRRSMRPEDREDLDLVAEELPALRERWPDAAAVVQSPEFEAFAVEARRRITELYAVTDEEREAEISRWVAEHNARARVWARSAPPCPSCAAPGPHPLVDENVGPLYLKCACGNYFGPPE